MEEKAKYLWKKMTPLLMRTLQWLPQWALERREDVKWEKGKKKRTEGEQVGLIWSQVKGRRATDMPGLQAEETLAMRNGPQMSIHQLLVLLDHLYLWAILSTSQPMDWCGKHFPSKPFPLSFFIALFFTFSACLPPAVQFTSSHRSGLCSGFDLCLCVCMRAADSVFVPVCFVYVCVRYVHIRVSLPAQAWD